MYTGKIYQNARSYKAQRAHTKRRRLRLKGLYLRQYFATYIGLVEKRGEEEIGSDQNHVALSTSFSERASYLLCHSHIPLLSRHHTSILLQVCHIADLPWLQENYDLEDRTRALLELSHTRLLADESGMIHSIRT